MQSIARRQFLRYLAASPLLVSSPGGRLFAEEMLDSIDLDSALDFYRDRFADAGDFTFILVGAFAEDDLLPLVERYLASLPSTGRDETWRDPGIEPPIHQRHLELGLEVGDRPQTADDGAGAQLFHEIDQQSAEALDQAAGLVGEDLPQGLDPFVDRKQRLLRRGHAVKASTIAGFSEGTR